MGRCKPLCVHCTLVKCTNFTGTRKPTIVGKPMETWWQLLAEIAKIQLSPITNDMFHVTDVRWSPMLNQYVYQLEDIE